MCSPPSHVLTPEPCAHPRAMCSPLSHAHVQATCPPTHLLTHHSPCTIHHAPLTRHMMMKLADLKAVTLLFFSSISVGFEMPIINNTLKRSVNGGPRFPPSLRNRGYLSGGPLLLSSARGHVLTHWSLCSGPCAHKNDLPADLLGRPLGWSLG